MMFRAEYCERTFAQEIKSAQQTTSPCYCVYHFSSRDGSVIIDAVRDHKCDANIIMAGLQNRATRGTIYRVGEMEVSYVSYPFRVRR